MLELFENKQWNGEFFTNDDFSRRFFGRINYAPDEGVVLDYWISSNELPLDSVVVHGVLETGEKCTLLGEFSTEGSGISFKDGLAMRIGKIGFACVLLGDFITEGELFYDVNFSLTNLQEFFFSKGFKELVKYSEKPLITIKSVFGEIQVTNNARFGSLYDDITKQVYSWDQQALMELQSAFAEVKAKNPKASFMLKKDIEYRLSLKIDGGADLNKVYEYISNLADLFAVLIHGPVHPESIQIVKKVGKDDESVKFIKFYPSTSLSSKTITLSSQDASHFHLPITNNKVDLASLIAEWMSSPDRFSTIVSSIQNETGYREVHSLHGELVLFSTQFETISYDDGQKVKKYEYPLIRYGTELILDGVKTIFARFGELDVGAGISNLRNEIAHVGRPKRLIKLMPMEDLILLSQYLELTIVGYMLSKIGVDSELIKLYQDRYCPQF